MSAEGPSTDGPPRLVANLLGRALGPGVPAASLLGDLYEEYHRRAGSSRRHARLWYVGTALQLGTGAVGRRALAAPVAAVAAVPRSLSVIVRDLGMALRWLARRPLFSLSAVASIAIGIAAFTSAWGVVHTVFFRPQAGVVNPHRMVDLQDRSSSQITQLSFPELSRLQEGVPSFSALAAHRFDDMSVTVDEVGIQVWGTFVTTNYFEAVGAVPTLGRAFRSDEGPTAGGNAVVVVSDRFWRDRLGGEPRALGRTLELDGETVTVIGVAPPSFQGHFRAVASDLWVPIAQMRQVRSDPTILGDPSQRGWNVIGRLAEGRALSQAQIEVNAVQSALAEDFPEVYADGHTGVRLVPYSPIPNGRGSRPIAALALAVMVLAGLVLAVTASNVAGMLLARSATQGRQIALRMVLGASRSRIMLYSLSETLVLFAMGGMVGVAIAWFANSALDVSALPLSVAVRLDFAPDVRVLAAGLFAAFSAAVVFGIGPALWSTRMGLSHLLAKRHAGAPRTGLRGAFVSGQVATALVLASASLLFVRSAHQASEMPRGYIAEGRYTVSADLGIAEGETPEQVAGAGREILADLRRAGPFGSVAMSSDLPLDGGWPTWPIVRLTGPDRQAEDRVYRNVVSVGYFEALQIARHTGRLFDEQDRLGSARVAIVNQAYATRFGEETESVLGQRFHAGSPDEVFEIVGIVDDVPDGNLRSLSDPMVYLALAQNPLRRVQVTAEARPGTTFSAQALSEALVRSRPSISLGPVHALSDLARVATFDQRAGVALTSFLAAVGLLLSGLGVYAVAGLRVSARRREIGIRMALGADGPRIGRRVVFGAVVLALPGVLLGCLAAAGLSLLLRSFLYGVAPFDPYIVAGVASVALIVVTAGSVGPATSAASVDPGMAARAD